MRFRPHTLLIVLAVMASLPGCRDRKIEQIQRGAENVDRHAKEIEQAAEVQP
jgi:hypothetical protein